VTGTDHSTTDHSTETPRSTINKARPPAGGGVFAAPPGAAVSPEEGAALVRAFLRIEQQGVRAAIIDLVTRLSQTSP